MPLTFVTLAPGFEESAVAFADRLRDMGATVHSELNDGSTPRTPTLVGVRGAVRHYADVVSRIDLGMVRQWVSYCKCRPNEAFYSIILPSRGRQIAATVLASLRELGVGVYLCDCGVLAEIVSPRDLSMNLSLPDLLGEKRVLKVVLAPAYAKFERGEWTDGFKDACQLLEARARKALVSSVRSGTVSFTKNGAPKAYTEAQIKRQTLGQLSHSYSEIVLPTAQQQVVARALRELNPDRIGAVHKANDGRVRRRLRSKVGVHMWMVVNGLRELV